MQPQGVIEFHNERWWQLSDTWSEAPHVNGPDLFRLGFGRACQAGPVGVEKCLKGKDPCDIRGHRNDGHHTTTKALRSCIGAVVADNHHRSSFVGFGSAYRL